MQNSEQFNELVARICPTKAKHFQHVQSELAKRSVEFILDTEEITCPKDKICSGAKTMSRSILGLFASSEIVCPVNDIIETGYAVDADYYKTNFNG